MDRVKIGNTFRAIRMDMRLRQADVAARAHVSQQTVSRLECGRFGGLSIDAYSSVAEAIGADVRLAPYWRGAKLDRLIDRRHALIQNEITRLLASQGWQLGTEKSFNHFGDRGSVDVLAWRANAGALLIVEIKTEIANLEETLRVLDMKARVVPGLVSRAGEWQPRIVGAVLVLPDATAHRDLVARHSERSPRPCRREHSRYVAGLPTPPVRSAGSGSSQAPAPAARCGT
ncbi:MAG TPA: helix-turn-helix domain-containing protein [Candidatus Limnocylindrales bacterium]